jgi:hypothetical protein
MYPFCLLLESQHFSNIFYGKPMLLFEAFDNKIYFSFRHFSLTEFL